MQRYEGKSVLAGIAIGKIHYIKNENKTLPIYSIKDDTPELARFEAARETARHELIALFNKALVETTEEQAMIFDVHQMMLDDLDYVERITDNISQKMVNAEEAVREAGETFSNTFKAMDDEYMQARSADILDISKRIIRILLGDDDADDFNLKTPAIIVADDLSPSETTKLDKKMVLAFVIKNGSFHSHTAILAKALNLPTLINIDLDLDESLDGKFAIVDSIDGCLYIDPTDEKTKESFEKHTIRQHMQDELKALIGKKTVSKSGVKVHLYANIGTKDDVTKVLSCDAEGIGLFRSEFIYLGRTIAPTEQEQFEIYKDVFQALAPKKVIIRTLDIGADKQVDYLGLSKEDNPALGYRAIRICLDQIDLFKTQLKAIYRAAAFGNVSIMFPMIISVSEIIRIKEIIEQVKAELKAADIPFGDAEIGIMIETPAAVMISDLLAKEVSFFSIGTNDLTQYTLAIDRQNPKLETSYDAHHEAILRMIRMTIINGHKYGVWVGICGELAADESLTETFLGMGVDELSVSPTFVLPLRKKIRDME